MKILYDKPIKRLKEIVESKAKYQKVMLLFDDSVSNSEIHDIYCEIKGLCVYNQSNISSFDEKEIYNGYRLIIYYCMVDNFLKCNLDKTEFVNVYLPRDKAILPYFMSEKSRAEKVDDFLLLNSKHIDIPMISSINFNIFYNYFKNIIYGQKSEIYENEIYSMSYLNHEITPSKMIDCLNKMGDKMSFLDVDILKQGNIEYQDLVIVDLLLVDAFILLIESVKSQNLMLVDVYKSARENNELIEKFYRLYNNEAFTNLIILNYNCLNNFCLKTKQKITEIINFYEVDKSKVEDIIKQVKNYAKNGSDLMSYLYLYNIFNV